MGRPDPNRINFLVAESERLKKQISRLYDQAAELAYQRARIIHLLWLEMGGDKNARMIVCKLLGFTSSNLSKMLIRATQSFQNSKPELENPPTHPHIDPSDQ